MLPVRNNRLVAAAALFLVAGVQAASVEIYGRLPSIDEVSLSPDGEQVAFIRAVRQERVVAIKSLDDAKPLAVLPIGTSKVRAIRWADHDHLMIFSSRTTGPEDLGVSKSEFTQLSVYDIGKRQLTLVPDTRRVRGMNLVNVISGPVSVRRVSGHTVLFFSGFARTPTRTLDVLVSADLETGKEEIVAKGSEDVQGWLVDKDGQIAAEQKYSEEDQRWSLSVPRNGKLQEIAGGAASIDFPRLLGFGPGSDTLLMEVGEHGEATWKLLSVKDGSVVPAISDGTTLDSSFTDRWTGRLIGGSSSDDAGRHLFFDPKTQSRWDALVKAYGGDRVRLVSASDDFTKALVRVCGPDSGYQYALVDFETRKAVSVGDVYDGVHEIREVRRIEYRAGDGLRIPAYLTLPRGPSARNLPLVVLVHGGPAARDTADFDWWSQALADQGYAVLRSNYRGSTINSRFVAAGFGEFGRKMQTDLSDGVQFLVSEGIADPARVCIVGASYGGYAALAGVTLGTGTYRCAVSVAGIADLKMLLKQTEERDPFEQSRELRYWERFIGASGPSDPLLERISPIKHVDSVNVPILLVHGSDDTVVPYRQSSDMFDALRHSKKAVEFVNLEHEDHWLSRSETRVQMLQATVAFLRRNNPPD